MNYVSHRVVAYSAWVPKLWDETIEAHRRGVTDAILDTTARLVFAHGLRTVTMSQIAEQAGIGRATLYKYFPDVEAILHAWHGRQIAGHLEQLRAARDATDDPAGRLTAVLEAYALTRYESRGQHEPELARLLHHDEQVARAHRQLRELLREVIAAADIRTDVPAGELTDFCLHALGAAGDLRSKAAVHRLVEVTIAGLTPVSR
jgi:AcrR family transcriptional regulator